MHIVEIVLLLIAACVGFALVARTLALPYAVVLVVGGMILAVVPGVPHVALQPELALTFFLPPLLMGSAFRTDLRGFHNNIRAILALAVGCVLFTTLCIAVVAKWLVPDMHWAAAIALGAIVAPPDAVAAAAVLQRLRLPRRVVAVLEGESLINDASALILYRFAVAAVAVGSVSLGDAALQFLVVGLGGIAMGLIFGRIAAWAIARIEDPVLETACSFLVCYASYLGADAAELSGVISVVTTGLVLGQAQYHAFAPSTRLYARTIWDFIEFVLNSLVFILIGLQLNQILARLSGDRISALVVDALVIAATLIVSRFLWVFPSAWVQRAVPGIRRQGALPSAKETAVIGWAGMRGVVSLAAAIALPVDFPYRDLIVFLAFTAILATLVLQGTTLEWLIKLLGIALPQHSNGVDPAEAEARRLVAEAALAEIQARMSDPLEGAIAADLLPEYRDRAGHLHRFAAGEAAAAAERTARRRLRLDAIEAARQQLLDHHRTSGLPEDMLMRLTQELDLEETRIRQVLGDDRTAAERHADVRARRRRNTPLLFHLPPHG